MTDSTTMQSTSRSAPTGRGGMGLHALIGAAVMIVLSFVPFSPVLGGAAAGYLHKREGLKVGALAGLFAAIPVAVGAFLLVSLLSITSIADPAGGMMNPLVVFGLMGGLMLTLIGLYTAGLGALGGYLGVYLHDRNATRP